METRVITMRYDEMLHGFPEEEVKAVADGRIVRYMHEHVFVHDNVPHMTVVLVLGDEGETRALVDDGHTSKGKKEDPSEGLTDSERVVYQALHAWRMEEAGREKVPNYVVAKNSQLVRIAKVMPKTLEELKTQAKMSDAFCERRGESVLRALSSVI